MAGANIFPNFPSPGLATGVSRDVTDGKGPRLEYRNLCNVSHSEHMVYAG